MFPEFFSKAITEVNPKLNNYDPEAFNENSIKGVIDFVDNLLYLRWQDAYKDLLEVRTPLEEKIVGELSETDSKALELYKKNPEKAKELLTGYSWKTTDEIHKLYTDLRYQLLIKYTNNKQGINFK